MWECSWGQQYWRWFWDSRARSLHLPTALLICSARDLSSFPTHTHTLTHNYTHTHTQDYLTLSLSGLGNQTERRERRKILRQGEVESNTAKKEKSMQDNHTFRYKILFQNFINILSQGHFFWGSFFYCQLQKFWLLQETASEPVKPIETPCDIGLNYYINLT